MHKIKGVKVKTKESCSSKVWVEGEGVGSLADVDCYGHLDPKCLVGY